MQSTVHILKPQKAAKNHCPSYNFINSLTDTM